LLTGLHAPLRVDHLVPRELAGVLGDVLDDDIVAAERGHLGDAAAHDAAADNADRLDAREVTLAAAPEQRQKVQERSGARGGAECLSTGERAERSER